MARRKETQFSNRKQMKSARETLKALSPEQREALWWNGLRPGMSYDGMWRMLNRYRRRLASLDGQLDRSWVLPRESQALERLRADERYYSEQVIAMYGKLLLHEKPKLQSIQVTGDPSKPVHLEVDLTGLPDRDLDDLARILPKLGGSADVSLLGARERKVRK